MKNGIASRRWFVPEVVQTSAMDCGPATLKALLAGFGLPASYGRLREACHTTVDGTSINTLEDLANQLGLEAEQVIVPVEHVFDSENPTLPAIAVTRQPNGLTHFMVFWRRVGSLIQVMDPGRGRQYVARKDLEQAMYLHETEIAVEDARAWMTAPGFLDPLGRRIRRLGLGKKVLAQAQSSSQWQDIAALDAAVRATEKLVTSSAISRHKAATAFALLWESTQGQNPFALVPPTLWSVRPAAESDGVWVRGAVLLGVVGLREGDASLPESLASVVKAKEKGPATMFWRLLKEEGALRFLPLFAALFLAGLATVAEALIFRSAFDIADRLATFEQRLLGALGFALLLVGFLCLELPLFRGLARLGRVLELGLRRAFLRKLPRLGDAYFQSRPISAMAESAHLLHWVRLLPTQAGQLVRATAELAATTLGLLWLHPPSTIPVLLVGAIVFSIPWLSQPYLLERDLRMRGHAGALARFYLDALLGVQAIRAHTAEQALLGEHEGRLREWSRSALGFVRGEIIVNFIQGVVGFGLSAVLVGHYLYTADSSGWAILFVYWAFMLPLHGDELAFLLQQYPQHRSITLRLMEPLGAEESGSDEDHPDGSNQPLSEPAELHATGVTVEASGHTLLTIDDLHIRGGEHVAIVGGSGAGKSTLLGLFLGFHTARTGSLLVGGEPLQAGVLGKLRQHTVWVDPSVQIWNRSLLDNLRYGNPPGGLDEAMEAAELQEILGRLPMGLQTPLGAGGGLLSGGEGQRVRIGRAVGRGHPRLVVLDEAFCGLERVRRRSMLEAARRRWAAATLLCVSHDIGEARAFPRVLVIENGCIQEDGSPAELLARPNSRFAELLAAETRAQERLAGKTWKRMYVADGKVTVEDPR